MDHDNPQTRKRLAEGKSLGGRPRTASRETETYDAALLKQIDEAALRQCKDGTIARAVGIDPDTFKREFAARTEKKRAEGKVALYESQWEQRSNPTMAIWLGKQHLGQVDKRAHEHGLSDDLSRLIKQIHEGTNGNGNGHAGSRLLPSQSDRVAAGELN